MRGSPQCAPTVDVIAHCITNTFKVNSDEMMAKIQVPDDTPRIVNNNPSRPSTTNPSIGINFPGKWREPAPVTTKSTATLELSPDTKLYGRPGEVVNLRFYLTNLSNTSKSFVISVSEFGPNNFPILGIQLPRTRINNIKSGEKEAIMIDINISRSANYPKTVKKQIALDVQPIGNTLSGKYHRLFVHIH